MPKSATSELIGSWAQCVAGKPPFLLPGDEAILESKRTHRFSSFEDYIASSAFGGKADHSHHLDILPMPYVGCLSRASIFVLMLNPGFSPDDYYFEHKDREYRSAVVNNLRQQGQDELYPFIFLNPRFSAHAGFRYWHSRLSEIVRKIAVDKKTSYQEALSFLSRKICCLELVPYHSASFGLARGTMRKLHSVQLMRNFVREVLIPRALKGTALIVATRSKVHWELPKHAKIIVYEGGETRGAHLTPNSRGGLAIAEHLGLHRS